VTDFIELYLLTEDDSLLHDLSALRGPFIVRPPFGTHLGEMDVLVTGLDRHITQEQWLAAWPQLRRLLDRSVGVVKGKRASLERHLRWWEERKVYGKPVPDIIAQWNHDHPDEPVLEETTVYRGIQRIDNLMRPAPRLPSP